MNSLKIFVDPFDLFNEVNTRPDWLRPFIIVSLLGMLSVLLTSPVLEHLVSLEMPEGAGADFQEQLLSMSKFSTYYGIAATPVFVLLKWSILSFLLFSISILSGADTSYRKMLSVIGHASIITALDGLLNLVAIYARGINTLRSANEIHPTLLSINNFVSTGGHPILRTLFDNLGILSIWYLAVLAIGVAATARLSKTRSALIVGALWALQTGFWIGVSMIFSRYEALSI